MSNQAEEHAGLRRDLTLLDAIMVNMGTMIASGIFLVPATIAHQLQFSGLILLAWVAGGIVSILGALAVAELGAAMPKVGGHYIYLREAYGELWGFLYGWTAFAVINTASISAIAVGFATYLGTIFPLSALEVKTTAIVSIVILTAINCYGLKFGAIVQNVLTIAKIAAFGGLLAAGFVLSAGSWSNLVPFLPDQSSVIVPGTFGLAVLTTLWAYDGWIEVTFVAGEVKSPQRNLPLSIIFSTLAVVVLYSLVNLVYLYVLSPNGVAGSSFVASDTAAVLAGSSAATFMAIAIMISMLGSNNGIVFTAARIPFAMAREGEFFKMMGLVHPRFHTPAMALIAQGVLACLFVTTGTYDQLITYVVFASFIFYGMTAGAVIVLRKKQPELERPYKTWGYPITPIVFMIFSGWLVFNTIMEAPRDAAIGSGIILLGLPAFYYWKK